MSGQGRRRSEALANADEGVWHCLVRAVAGAAAKMPLADEAMPDPFQRAA